MKLTVTIAAVLMTATIAIGQTIERGIELMDATGKKITDIISPAPFHSWIVSYLELSPACQQNPKGPGCPDAKNTRRYRLTFDRDVSGASRAYYMTPV